MNTKYVMLNGLAFSEESDIERLKNYAKKGWILEGISAGIFYKLRKDKPQNIEYSLDYQSQATEEYFEILAEAGWKKVVSLDIIHIFSAPEGTRPIYSDSDTEIYKYDLARKKMKRGTIFSLTVLVALLVLLIVSAIAIRPIFLVVMLLFFVSMGVFIINLMTWSMYNYRTKIMRKNEKPNQILSMKLWKVYIPLIGCLLIMIVVNIIEKKFFYASCLTSIAICCIVFSITSYKNRNDLIQK